ncbi:MAG: hypothetical protein ACJA1L_003259, partial [Paracoccaceae bacterium]
SALPFEPALMQHERCGWVRSTLIESATIRILTTGETD